jgi:hypothetical protein
MMAAFTKHPESVGETYVEHMGVAALFGTRMLLGALACYLHALFPFLFEKTASTTIAKLHERMVVSRRQRRVASHAGASESLMNRAA